MQTNKWIIAILKIIKRIGIVILLVLIFNLIPRPKSVAKNNFLVNKNHRPVLIAHGGGNMEFPDNTLEAFYNALSIDPNVMMETDVHMTKDGVIILSHDGSFDRKTDASGNVIDWNYTDLISQEVDFNYHSPTSGGVRTSEAPAIFKNYEGKTVTPLDVPYPDGILPRHESKFLATTLEELIIHFPNNAINVEIKQSGEIGLHALDSVISLMDKLDGVYNTYSRIVLASFHTEIFKKIKEYHRTNPAILFSPNSDGAIMLYVTHWFGFDFICREPVSVLQIPTRQGAMPLDGRLFINAAHRHNIAVHYWTINDENTMRDLANKGADGIMSDKPSLLKKVLDDMYGPGDSQKHF